MFSIFSNPDPTSAEWKSQVWPLVRTHHIPKICLCLIGPIDLHSTTATITCSCCHFKHRQVRTQPYKLHIGTATITLEHKPRATQLHNNVETLKPRHQSERRVQINSALQVQLCQPLKDTGVFDTALPSRQVATSFTWPRQPRRLHGYPAPSAVTAAVTAAHQGQSA